MAALEPQALVFAAAAAAAALARLVQPELVL
jgi:hypothetical protein